MLLTAPFDWLGAAVRWTSPPSDTSEPFTEVHESVPTPYRAGEHTAQAGDDDGRGWLQAIMWKHMLVEEGLGALRRSCCAACSYCGYAA